MFLICVVPHETMQCGFVLLQNSIKKTYPQFSARANYISIRMEGSLMVCYDEFSTLQPPFAGSLLACSVHKFQGHFNPKSEKNCESEMEKRDKSMKNNKDF